MTELETIKKKLFQNLPRIREKYGIEEMGLFGSFIKGENESQSDVDILVSFNDNVKVDLFDFLDIKDELKSILGKNVDLVEKSGLKPNIGKRILNDVVYL